MNVKNRIITALGGIPKETNNVHRNDFLRYGSRRRPLPSDWTEVKMDDEDIYRGYPYAVIQKRGNKVATLARENLYTWVKPEFMDEFQKREQDPTHPYLKLIEDSTDFSVKQFWKTICVYLDLAGVYYLAAVRQRIPSKSRLAPDIYGDVQQFILLNPYEIKRIKNNDGQVAGYIETKPDGRQREWPVHMIIPMKELNPFDNDKVWSMTDAAKESVFTLQQSGNYTRETIGGNLNAPGIITTDVILEDNQFADFVERVRGHNKGEPVFGNGAGAIKWEAMQVDLDKAALMDINEINRTTLFAISGTSKTSLGIEQSGTTRETARVQTEQFISDTAQPRLEDIIDFLNLDFKKYYPTEYNQVGWWLDIRSAASRDYQADTQATQMRQAQSALAFDLIQRGYTVQSSYDYAEGKIELSDLELEAGIEKPQNPEQPESPEAPTEEAPTEETPPENTPSDPPEGSVNDDTVEDDTDTVSDEENNNSIAKLEGLEPHADLKINSSEEATLDSRPQESKHNHQECDCGKVEVLINELGESDGKVLEESYKTFLDDLKSIQKETYRACIRKLNTNAFEESDIITPKKRTELTNKLKALIQKYWWVLTPLLANSLMEERNQEFGENTKFVFTNELQEKVSNNATRVAEGHMETFLNDLLGASNKAYTNVMEEKAAELLVEAYKTNTPKYVKYFEEQPTMTEALRAIRNTDILDENHKVYERASELAMQGYKRSDIVKAIREEYDQVSESRAKLIAQNETSRAYGHSQFEADTQFLNSIGQLDTAMKRLVSRRPENERDKICPICEAIINMGPIPFTQNFVSLGETITAERDGKVCNFLCNYEDIQSSTVHPNCFARDTQVYTNEGWKRVDSLTGKELFWSIDPKTLKPEWVKAKHLVQGYAEKLIRYQNKNFDMATTFDHNMFVEVLHGKKNPQYEFEFREAQDLARKDRFYAGVNWEGTEPETIKVGDYQIPTGLYCKFMGYYLSEGCANVYKAEGRKNGQRYQATIGQATRYDEFKKDLEKLPFRIWCGKEAFTFNDESVVKYCMQFGKSSEKYIPNEIKQLSPRLLKIFLDAFMLGDGHSRFREKTMSLERVLSTSSVTLRDDLTEIIQKAGFRPTVGLYKPKGTPYKGTNYLSNNDLWRISICNRVHTYKEATRKSIVDYYDDVFCVELEKNHTLWTMYNGRCWWSGNCMCHYELILNGRTLNEVSSDEPDSNDGSDGGTNDNSFSEQTETVNGNPYHEPAGSSKGGQFAKAPGGSKLDDALKKAAENYKAWATIEDEQDYWDGNAGESTGTYDDVYREFKKSLGKEEEDLDDEESEAFDEAMSQAFDELKQEAISRIEKMTDEEVLDSTLDSLLGDADRRMTTYDDGVHEKTIDRITEVLDKELANIKSDYENRGFDVTIDDSRISESKYIRVADENEDNVIEVRLADHAATSSAWGTPDAYVYYEDDYGQPRSLRETIQALKDELDDLVDFEPKQNNAFVVNGGSGSGNFGHAGRLGLVGGSAKDDSFMQELFFTPSFEKALESNPTLAKSLERQLAKFARNGLDIGRIRFGTMEIPDDDENFMSSGIFPAEPLENTFIMSNVVARGDTRFDEVLKQYYKDGWWAGGTLDYAIAHELGHAKTYQLMLAQDGNSFEDYGSEEEVVASSRALAKKIFLEATGGADIETLRHGKGGDISGYGYKRAKVGDYLEIIAEAYGNPNFSELSGKIVETLDKKHKALYNNSMKRRIATFDTSQIIASTVFHDKKAYEEYMRENA